MACTRDKVLGTHATKLDCFFGEEWKYIQYFGVDAAEALETMGVFGVR